MVINLNKKILFQVFVLTIFVLQNTNRGMTFKKLTAKRDFLELENLFLEMVFLFG